MTVREFIDFYLLGRHRLESIALLPLNSSVTDAIALYGQPLESQATEETSNIVRHVFAPGPYHEASAFEWNNGIHSIVYSSVKGDPVRDLTYVLECYKDSASWSVMEPGYWYQRTDGKVRLWCSAVPVIGVAHIDFLKAQAAYKLAHSVVRLETLPDVTWAPDDAVLELQRCFIEDGNSKLMELTQRSDRIAVSPDGGDVFIIRNHRAYDVEGGFQELNTPPEPGNGYSTQVINCFHYSKDGSSWSKVTLPRDAHVDLLRFDGDICRLAIRQTPTNRILDFSGAASTIRGLAWISISTEPHRDDELWEKLRKANEDHAEASG